MKQILQLSLVALLVLLRSEVNVRADDGKTTPPKITEKKSEKVEKPSKVDLLDEKVEKQPLPDDLKKLMTDLKQAREDFLQSQKELRKKYAEASAEEREKLRTEIKEKRQQFLEQQQDAREEIRKRLAELKDKLKEHQNVLEESKEQTRDRTKDRKGVN